MPGQRRSRLPPPREPFAGTKAPKGLHLDVYALRTHCGSRLGSWPQTQLSHHAHQVIVGGLADDLAILKLQGHAPGALTLRPVAGTVCPVGDAIGPSCVPAHVQFITT